MRSLLALLSLPLLLPLPVLAQADVADAAGTALETEAPIPSLLAELGPEVALYDRHVTFLANPFLEGRLPGTEGMEIASQYVERHFAAAGLEQPFGEHGYRQPFDLGTTTRVRAARLAVAGGDDLRHGEEYSVTGFGGEGAVEGPVVFCGYGIERGREGYRGFPEETDLTGAVALIFRFEPMDEEGVSLWSTRGPWTSRASFTGKIKALVERGAAAVLIVNPPGADDPRVDQLMTVGQGSRPVAELPVLMLRPEAGQHLLRAGGVQADLLELRRAADEAGVVRPLGFSVAVDVALEREAVVAENVIGLLPGRGALAQEYVVVGAHLDHLGTGNFGSREGPGEIHPGADDNASGSAGVLMLAERLGRRYEGLPAEADARSVLFMCFSAEESGLNGSRYYTEEPLVPIGQHVLMINFDMIGRVRGKRLSVSGAGTGEGMDEWLAPFFEASPLTIVQPENMSGASDHTPFFRAGMPVLFAIIADFHDDYHTPRDVVEKINRLDAVHVIDLFSAVLEDAALRPARFPLAAPEPRAERLTGQVPQEAAAEREPGRPVRLGVRPDPQAQGAGVVLASVTAGGAAAEAGVLAGDRLLKWNGKALAGVEDLAARLSECQPGDRVQVTLERTGEAKVVWVTLAAASDG